ncbi:MAG: tetratricopeptide repeat protein [Candidatus Woesearchaeota archaeon]|nr:tetratricopeptide repeat protein [Candidatus Woesearchaeota archaeon]
MNQKKAAVTVMIVVIMGIIIMLITVFVPATSIARQFGWISAKNTEDAYVKIAEQIRETGQKGQGTRTQALLIKMDSDSAILGFSSGSQGIKIIRDWGMDFEFPRPPECGPSSCVCLCRQIEHTTVFGKEAYYCKASEPGEIDPKKKYMECEKDLGVDIQYSIKKDDFAKGLNYVDYGSEGGFFMGRATTSEGAFDSKVFGMPEDNIQVWVEKGSSQFVAVCLNRDGCIDQNADQLEKNRIEATKLYNSAFDSFKENTPESLASAGKDYDSIVANPGYIDALNKATLMEQVYFNRAMVQYRLKNYDNAVKLLDEGLKELPMTGEGSEFYDTFTKERQYIQCEFIEKSCPCYLSDAFDLCEKSTLNCGIFKGFTTPCQSCSEIKQCSDYNNVLGGYVGKKEFCEDDNPCKLSPGCRWDEEKDMCVSAS